MNYTEAIKKIDFLNEKMPDWYKNSKTWDEVEFLCLLFNFCVNRKRSVDGLDAIVSIRRE